MKTLVLAAAASLLSLSSFAADLMVSDVRARISPNGKSGAVYFTLMNHGDGPVRLVASASPIARKVELHTHLMVDGVARMREVEGGVEALAGKTVTLEPGGLHVMLMGLSEAPEVGATFPVTLTFDTGQVLELEAEVAPLTGAAKGHGASSHGHGHKAGHGTTN